jgi:hypothetical protein
MEAYLVIGVLMFMASLLFCKSLLECVQALMHVLSECSGCAGNCECVSLNYGEKRSAREVLMILLVLWSIGKPCLLILGPLLGEFVLGQPPQWTVVFVQVVLNTSRFAHKQGPDETLNHSLHKAGPAGENDVQVQIREVEGLVLVMPFALLSASSTWTWVGLKNDGFFADDQVWDQELFTSRGMQLYEVSIQPYYGLQEISWSPKYGLCLGLAICRFTNKIQLSSSCSVECAREEERREGVSLTLSFSHSAILAHSLTLHGQTESGGHVVVLAVRCMLEPVPPGAVSPDRELCLPTYSHFLIVNKTSFSLSLSLPPSTLPHLSTDRQERKHRKPGLLWLL